MCGRTAQTICAVETAARFLGVTLPPGHSDVARAEESAPSEDPAISTDTHGALAFETTTVESSTDFKKSSVEDSPRDRSSGSTLKDNWNLSPGMDATVFSLNQKGLLCAQSKVWGLVTKPGTISSPISKGMGQHFSNLMFNARSDTLFQKPTFARLLRARKTCIVALRGFFEWKTVTGKKQPYFVFRKGDVNSAEQSYLLLAGLWTSVSTGRGEDVMDTFTVITQEACAELQWLHHRMPVCIWSNETARLWLEQPTESVLKRLELENHQKGGPMFQWHAVTDKMASVKFRSEAAIKPLPKVKTVTSFFPVVSKEEIRKRKAGPSSSQTSGESKTNESSKRSKKQSPQVLGKNKKPPKGTILLFFSPKTK